MERFLCDIFLRNDKDDGKFKVMLAALSLLAAYSQGRHIYGVEGGWWGGLDRAAPFIPAAFQSSTLSSKFLPASCSGRQRRAVRQQPQIYCHDQRQHRLCSQAGVWGIGGGGKFVYHSKTYPPRLQILDELKGVSGDRQANMALDAFDRIAVLADLTRDKTVELANNLWGLAKRAGASPTRQNRSLRLLDDLYVQDVGGVAALKASCS